jgi:uncharacterized protein (DUF1330 family)
VVTREKTRDASELDQYKQLAPPSFKEYPATIRAIHGRTEVLEGSAVEDIVILEFPTYEDAKAWYQSSTYQAASKHRHQGGDYRFILTEGTSTHRLVGSGLHTYQQFWSDYGLP